MSVVLLAKTLGRPLVYTPSFRFTYCMLESHNLHRNQFDDAQHALPSFQPENGMACSLGSLFRLSPAAAQIQPDLFTKILPALHDKDALVMSLYICTGQADRSATKERTTNATNPFQEEENYRGLAQEVLNCALGLEEQMVIENSMYTRVVWMLVSDSQDLKRWITETYTTTSSSNNDNKSLPRQVITTTSRGAHTRTGRKPSTADFAKGVLDWYLIGKSDLVIKDGKSPSFGGTAALRTARPVYDASSKGKCTTIIPIHERNSNMEVKESQLKRQGLRSGSKNAPPANERNSSVSLRRFPQYGTAAFAHQCEWTEYKGRPGNCTLLL